MKDWNFTDDLADMSHDNKGWFDDLNGDCLRIYYNLASNTQIHYKSKDALTGRLELNVITICLN